MKSVLQDWVMELGLRHQGTLLTAVRGCDTAPKDDPSKMFSRCFRAIVLNAFVGDPKKARTFIEAVDELELRRRFAALRKNVDHYPHHYLMHLIHACEVVAWKHPNSGTRATWQDFYYSFCHGLHLNPESEEQLDRRLNADEESFAAQQ